MRFFPEEPNDENLSQQVVWSRLREAFGADEGVAYYEYPISFPDGFKRYALDAVLVLQHPGGRFGAYVFETKGCRIHHINSIQGGDWLMDDWHSEREAPQRQVDHHKFAFSGVTKTLLGAGGGLDTIGFVALPRITRAQWQNRGFDQLPGTGNVLLLEDLEPDALRARLAAAARYARPLNAAQWLTLQRGLGGGAQPNPVPEGPTYPDEPKPVVSPGQLSLVTYQGAPPQDWVLRSRLFEEEGDQVRPYTYLVATALLARQRERLAPDHQCSEEGPHLLFKRAVRYFLTSRQLRVATRAEEQVLLGRAMDAGAGGNAARKAQLRRDLFRWQKAFAHLGELGVDLSGGLAHSPAQPLTQALGEIMEVAQPLFLQAQRQAQPHPTPTFEAAAYAYFASNHYKPTPVIYLEGFTFLTPLQQHFIDCSLAKGANVYLIYPDRPGQGDAYAVMQDTYRRFQAPAYRVKREPELPTDDRPQTSDLGRVQNHLFSDVPRVAFQEDGTLQLRAYGHLHEEVNGALRLVQRHLTGDAKLNPHEVVIVTRDPERYRAVLAEQAALLGIELNLSLPPRALLLTPTGRFILILYGIWNQGQAHITPEHFEAALRSGWLGTPARTSARVFASVQAQMFSRCTTPKEWQAAFDLLGAHLQQAGLDASTPAALVTQEHLALWTAALSTLTGLSTRLFSHAERSIGDHVRHLLQELDALPTAQTFEEERELLQHLRAALEELTTLSSLNLNGEEFGEVISGLVRQREEAADPSDMTPPPPGKVAVVAPESLDGASCRVVVYLGVDNRKVPRLNPSAWPFQDPQLVAQQLKERYLFLAVVRAASQELHLSYAMADERDRYTPSIFLTDIGRLINREIQPPQRSVVEEETAVPAEPPLPVLRASYTLDELFHFGLCPARYKLQRLALTGGEYSNSFQMSFLAQGVWLNHLWQALRADRPAHSAEALTAAFAQAKAQTEPAARQAFHGLRDLAWRGVDQQVTKELTMLTNRIMGYNGGFPITAEEGKSVTYSLNLDAQSTRQVTTHFTRQIRRGRATNLDTDDGMHAAWLIPGAKGADGAPQYREVEGLEVFATQYQAYRFWLDARKTLYYNDKGPGPAHDLRQVTALLKGLITKVEAGRYPKAPGDHCAFCPVQRPCLPTTLQEGS